MARRHQLRAVGLPARHGSAPRDRAAAVDQRRRRRARHRGCLRADRGRAGRAAVRGDAGRRRLPRPARRHGERAVRGRRGRAAAAGAGGRRPRRADRHQPRLPRQRHAGDGGAHRQPGRLSHLPARGPARDRAVRRPRHVRAARARAPCRTRAAQAAVPDPAQRPVHAGRAVEGRGRPLGGGRGRAGQPLLPRRLPALRPLLVRAGGDRACLEPGGRRPRGRRAHPRDRPARARVRRADGLARRRRARGDGHRAHGVAAGGARRHAGQSGLRLDARTPRACSKRWFGSGRRGP